MSTDLRAAITGHLAERRARGYRLEGREHLLGTFLDSLEARGETRITVPAALAFATAPAGTARAWHAQRLAAVRSFAGYVHAMDPAAAGPVPGGLISGRIARRVPYLYSGQETARLMTAAGTLPSPVLAASMRTLIGLLASPGRRHPQRRGTCPGCPGPGHRGAGADGHRQVRQEAADRAAPVGRRRSLGLPAVPGTARRGRHRRPVHRPGRPAPRPQHGQPGLPVAGHRMRPRTPAWLPVPETARFPPLGGRPGYVPCRGVSAGRGGGARVAVRIILLGWGHRPSESSQPSRDESRVQSGRASGVSGS